jgi:hypothetical protein
VGSGVGSAGPTVPEIDVGGTVDVVRGGVVATRSMYGFGLVAPL